nr:hypothetical protein BaRGS_017003 [Batillaria attramentaria]
MVLLEYENQIFLEGFDHDGLFIMAKGLGVDRIFLSYLNAYCDPGSLDYFMEQLEMQGVKPLPKLITNEFSASDRQRSYSEGGVQFITSRILVVDMLTDRVPVDKVTGMLVYKANKSVDMEEITVETALGKDFDRMVRLQLDPVWHMLSGKTRQLVSDLGTLRLILKYLTQYDCVTFYSLVSSIQTSEKTFGQNTGWLFLDAADSLFVNARQRVYGDPESKNQDKKDKTKKSDPDVPELEVTPKWGALKQVLEEIDSEMKQMAATAGEDVLDHCRVLVCAEDDRTCNMLREERENGKGAKQKKKRKRKAELLAEIGSELTLTQMARDTEPKRDELDQEGERSEAEEDGDAGDKYGIWDDDDVEDVEEDQTTDTELRVYFLLYTGSVEEQRYLTTLRREKEAFEYLIREKAGKYPMPNEVSLQETTSRLALLTMHFPKLRILWCPSPYATAEIFEELKVQKN